MSTPYCTDLILPLASGIYADIGSPTSQSVGYISGWLTATGGMIGALNNRLGTCVYVSGDNPCLVNFDSQMGPMASLIYQAGYFKTLSLGALAGGGAGLWTQLVEGDSRISRSDMVKVAGEYRAMYIEAEKQINKLLSYWTLNQTVPQGINGDSLYSYPSP